MVLIAVFGKTMAASVSYSVVGTEAELLRLAVDPVHRRQGLATELEQSGRLRLADRGVTDIYLEVRADNQPARSLYEGLGWQQVGLRRSYYSAGIDALVLHRTCAP